MRKIGLLVLAAACLALAILVLPGKFQDWKLAKADYAIAVERIAALDPAKRASLNLSDLDHLSDLPPEIMSKTNLGGLNLSNTDITDIGPLAALRNLKYLAMNDVPVRDLSPLAGLRRLDNLSLAKTWVFDLAPLAGLPQLEQLNLSNTAVKSLEPVLRLQHLRQLTLYHSYAHDGSGEHYKRLVRNVARVNNGNAYKQNYTPGFLYRAQVSYGRLKQRLGLSRPSNS